MSYFWRILSSSILLLILSFLLLFQPSLASEEEMQIGRIEGFAIKQPVHVYEKTSRNANVLKSYNYNHRLVYYPYSADWYSATVYLNGIAYRGYIHKEDVGINPASNVRGVALSRTNIFSSPDSDAKVLKSYKKGSILKYRSHSQGWYIATVYINGKRTTGYISAKDLETIRTEQQKLQGIGAKKPTKVYTLPSTDSKVLKTYKQGEILRYRSFTKDWYEATVYVNGVRKTGYIHSKDVEEIEVAKQETFKGIGIKNPTRIYSLASTDSKALKSYKQGQILKFRSLSKNWFEATVYVNGVRKTGYIHSKDIELVNHPQRTLNGIALKQPTSIYTYASKSSKKLKNYNYGHVIKFRTFSDNWYEATVYLNGKRHTGYLSKDDVNTNLNSDLKGYALLNRTPVYSDASRKSSILKEYKKGHLLKYQSYNSSWFKAKVYVNGQAKTGYIHTSDVSPNPLTFRTYALSRPTNVYSSKSRKSKILKSYKQGSLLKLYYHNSTWYEATVYIKGKPHKGYVHRNDVGDLPPKNANQDSNPPVIEEEIPPVTDQPEYRVPILMYHQVGEEPKPESYGLFVTAENFREQMNYLKNNGYTLISFDDLSNIENISNPIIVTFDDGYENNLTAYEILNELKDESFHPKATFFIIGSKIDTNGFLSREQIKEISDSGIVSIQSHTMTHPFFNDKEKMDRLNYTFELSESKSILEEITGKEVNTIAYPYGSYNDKVIEETKKYYDYAVTTRSGIASSNDSQHEFPRVRVRYDTTIEQFAKLIGE